MRVIVTAVHVTDARRAYAFYSEVLGMRDVVVVPDGRVSSTQARIIGIAENTPNARAS